MGGYIVKWWDIWWFIDGLAAHGWAATMVIIYHHLNFDDPIHLIHPRVSYSIEPQQLLGIHGVIDCQWGSKRRSPRPRRAWRAWSPRWGAPGPVSWFFHIGLGRCFMLQDFKKWDESGGSITGIVATGRWETSTRALVCRQLGPKFQSNSRPG